MPADRNRILQASIIVPLLVHFAVMAYTRPGDWSFMALHNKEMRERTCWNDGRGYKMCWVGIRGVIHRGPCSFFWSEGVPLKGGRGQVWNAW